MILDPWQLKAQWLIDNPGPYPIEPPPVPEEFKMRLIEWAKKECHIDLTDYINYLADDKMSPDWMSQDIAFQVDRIKRGL